jgi:hypothetical protein
MELAQLRGRVFNRLKSRIAVADWNGDGKADSLVAAT